MPKLTMPYFVLGFVAALIVVDTFDGGREDLGLGLLAFVPLFVPLVCVGIARFVTWERRLRLGEAPMLATYALDALLVAAVSVPATAALFSLALGLSRGVACGLLLSAGLVLIATAAPSTLETVRSGSILAGAARRQAWTTTAALIPWATLIAELFEDRFRIRALLPWAAPAMAVIGTAALSVLVVRTAHDAQTLWRATALPTVPRSARPAYSTLDYGVGHEESEEAPVEKAIHYRQGAMGVRVHVGSSLRARRWIAVRLALGVLALAPTVFATAARVGWHLSDLASRA
jgi:hypothetical protein